MSRAHCTAPNSRSERCGAYPIAGGELCFAHDPAYATEAAEARRLGGQRRRKERVVAGAYELGEVATPEGLKRLLSIAATDLLQLDNTVPRNRALIHLVHVGTRLLETDDLNERLEALESAVGARLTSIRGGRSA
jgi:hypothetical protein